MMTMTGCHARWSRWPMWEWSHWWKGNQRQNQHRAFWWWGCYGIDMSPWHSLFLVNIDMPGEQQKYPVALVEHLFTLIPDHSTVAVLYDVACVLDHSLEKVHLSHLPGTKAHDTWKVQHFIWRHSFMANLWHHCNACVWTPVIHVARGWTWKCAKHETRIKCLGKNPKHLTLTH